MRVYLAGKIKGASQWRDLLVYGWSGTILDDTDRRDSMAQSYSVLGENTDVPEWPILPKAFLGFADYVGPYGIGRAACPGDHCADSSPAGLHHLQPGDWGGDRQKGVVRRCVDGVAAADVVVAVFTADSPGTLCEIGYAVAKSKPVVAVVRRSADPDWFPLALCQVVHWIEDDLHFWDNAIGYFKNNLFAELARTADMSDYYRSRWWKARRAAALELVGDKCQFCGGTGVELSVHHNSYANLYREPDADLVVLCDPCHRTADVRRREREKTAAAGGRNPFGL